MRSWIGLIELLLFFGIALGLALYALYHSERTLCEARKNRRDTKEEEPVSSEADRGVDASADSPGETPDDAENSSGDNGEIDSTGARRTDDESE